MLAALIEGQLLYKTKLPFWLSSAIGVALTILSIVIGFLWPFINVPSLNTLYWLQFIYIIFAAALPVWLLLQPRDYLNSYILWGGVIIATIAAVIAFRGFSWPASILASQQRSFLDNLHHSGPPFHWLLPVVPFQDFTQSSVQAQLPNSLITN
jgi:carbon starvation protein